MDAGGFQGFRCGDFGEDISAPDAFELVRIAKKNKAGVVRQRLQEGLPEHRIDHGALVHDENLAGQAMPSMVGATVFTGIVAKQGVDRLARAGSGFELSSQTFLKDLACFIHGLLHAVRRLACGGGELDGLGIKPPVDEEGEDAGERIGFSRAGPAGNDGEAFCEGHGGGIALEAFLGKTVGDFFRRAVHGGLRVQSRKRAGDFLLGLEKPARLNEGRGVMLDDNERRAFVAIRRGRCLAPV